MTPARISQHEFEAMRTTKTKGLITKARAKAMNIKGLRTRRAKKAVKLCDQLITTLNTIELPTLAEHVGMARNAINVILLRK